MTVTTAPRTADYRGDGATVTFPVPFRFLAAAHLRVVLIDATGTETAGAVASVAGVGAATGGTVTLTTAPATGVRVMVFGHTPLSQEVDFTPGGAMPGDVVERAFDKLAMGQQEQAEKLSRAVVIPRAAGVRDLAFPAPVANKGLKFDGAGKLVTTGLDADAIASHAQQMAQSAQAAQSAAAVSEQAAKTSETNAAASATAAGASATKASASETTAAASATAAKTSATAAAVSEAAAQSSATKAKTSETNASTSRAAAAGRARSAAQSAMAAKASENAAKTSERNAAQSATTAATQASDATKSAGAAKTSATAAKASQSAAAGSATQSAGSATSAAGSATTATNQASNAAQSATAAAGSATASQSAATAAQASATQSAGSAGAAKTSATNAAASETAAAASATAAQASETNAAASAAQSGRAAATATGAAARVTGRIATQAQAEAGTDDSHLMTPQRTQQFFDKNQRPLATQAQAEKGTDNSHLMTPELTAAAIAKQGWTPKGSVHTDYNTNGVVNDYHHQSGISKSQDADVIQLFAHNATPIELTGLADGKAGRIVHIQNLGDQDIVIKQRDSRSKAENRFWLRPVLLHKGHNKKVDLILKWSETATFLYLDDFYPGMLKTWFMISTTAHHQKAHVHSDRVAVGRVNDYQNEESAVADVIQLARSSDFDLTGIATGWDGRQLRVQCTGGGDVTLKHNSTHSAAGNRIWLSPSAYPAGEVKLQQGDTATLLYMRYNASVGAVWVLTGVTQAGGVSVPTGTILPFAGAALPAGYLRCDGASVSRTTYAELFGAISTTYGAGNGSTTFDLPDLRGEFLRGLDRGRGVDSGRTLGSAQGDAIRNMTGVAGPIAETFGSGGAASGVFQKVNTSGTYTPRTVDTSSAGKIRFDASRVVPTASENRPRNVAVNCIIKY